MLLRNYYNFMACAMLGIKGYQPTGSGNWGDGILKGRLENGTTSNIINAGFGLGGSTGAPLSSASQGTSSLGSVILGSGNSPVTFEDYKLDSRIDSGLSKGTIIVKLIGYDSSTKKYTSSMTIPVTNISGSSPINIKEVGILFSAQYNIYILVYRDVLPETVTIAPGETQILELQFEYTFPEVPTT